MLSSRIKNLELATQLDAGQLVWHRHITPITEHYACLIAQRDYRGKKLAYWGHIINQSIIMMVALQQAGAEIALGAIVYVPLRLLKARHLGCETVSLFDHYTVVMLFGIAWMFDGSTEGIAPGLQQYPAQLEREIAELAVRIHSES